MRRIVLQLRIQKDFHLVITALKVETMAQVNPDAYSEITDPKLDTFNNYFCIDDNAQQEYLDLLQHH